MMPPRAISAQDLALAIDASVALEDETHPHRLLGVAEGVSALLPRLAEDLRREARQGVRLRLMLARASLGDLIAIEE